MMKSSLIFCVFAFTGLSLSAQDVPKPEPAEEPEFKRPQPRHRTSRPVPVPWLGFGRDDHPAIRAATYLMKPEEIRAMPLRGKNGREP
ncbi:MAG: hypothetical protein VCA36_06400, partial [Opitutales bacterium]